MNSISVLSMDLGGVFLNVLAIIGIIIAGGFLIFFLGDLLLSILDPKNNSLNQNDKQKHYEQEKIASPTKPQELTYVQQPQLNQQSQNTFEKSQGFNSGAQAYTYKPMPYQAVDNVEIEHEQTNQFEEVDFEKALQEEKMLFQNHADSEKTIKPEPAKVVEPAVNSQLEEETTTEDIFKALKLEEQAYIQKKINEEKPKQIFPSDDKVEQEEEDEFNFDDIFFTDNEEDDEIDFDFDMDFDQDETDQDETDQDEAEQEQSQENNQQEEQKQVVDNQNQSLNQNAQENMAKQPDEQQESKSQDAVQDDEQDKQQELKNLQDENLTLKKEIEKLLAEHKQKQEELEKEKEQLLAAKSTKQVSAPLLSLEAYQQRLEELKERLKFNEKELRAIKREYLPLKRVRATLERDKKKLRRREALVAKQKILLYGVNNMADIDQEKAQKLEEDLDLLDGLRLSVQHCEEVIKNSEERYPVLEKSFNILTTTINQIKSDIQQVEQQMEKLPKKDSKN